MTTVRSATFVGATAFLLLLTGCVASGSPYSSTGDVSASPAHDAPAAAAGGDAFGCTDAMIAFMDANGYADPTPADPAGFTFPESAAPPAVPACYVVDDFGGTARKGAIFVGDTDAAIAASDRRSRPRATSRTPATGPTSGGWTAKTRAPPDTRWARSRSRSTGRT